MLLIVGFGLGELFNTFPIIHKIVKVVGICYMLYLALKTVFASTKIQAKGGKRPITFIAASLFQWLNPKTWIMTVGVFATFSNGIAPHQVWIITAIYAIVSFPCIFLWLAGGVILKTILKNELHIRIFNIITGSLLALSIVLIL